MSNLVNQFREEIEAFLKESGINATDLGKQAVNDPAFVLDIRNGRAPKLDTVDKVRAFMAKLRAA